MNMKLKTTKNMCCGLSIVFKITTRWSTIDVRKKSDISRKKSDHWFNRTCPENMGLAPTWLRVSNTTQHHLNAFIIKCSFILIHLVVMKVFSLVSDYNTLSLGFRKEWFGDVHSTEQIHHMVWTWPDLGCLFSGHDWASLLRVSLIKYPDIYHPPSRW